MRPKSIVLFERLYLLGWILSVVTTALQWDRLESNPQVIEARELIGAWFIPTLTAVCLIVPLILWALIARGRSAVAKWLMVMLTVLLVYGALSPFLDGGSAADATDAVSIIGTALTVIAVALLFRPDSRAWFGESDEVSA